MSNKQEETEQRKRGDRWFLLLVLILFLAGLGIRGYAYLTETTGSPQNSGPTVSRSHTQKTFSTTLRDGEQRAIRPEDRETSEGINLVAELAPYLTEGGLSFFLGFCIGYFLRVLAKTAMFFVGALYVCLILLSHYGMITVDWGSFQHVLQQILLNTKTHVEGLSGIIAVGIPSVTMGCLGIWRGFKKPK